MKGFEILEKEELARGIKLFVVSAPLIAKKAKAGQFALFRVDEKGERFPLTLVDWSPEKGSVTIVFQEVGVSTKKLGKLKVGDRIMDVVGPLGNPAEIKKYGETAVVGGGVGVAPAYPRIKALKKAGNHVTSIIGAKTADLLILEKKIGKISDELYVSTDDGSRGFKGFTSNVLKNLLDQGKKFKHIYAVGPVPMMRAVAEVTRPHGIPTVVSLNPIMVDGTGMCGGCRVMVGGETKFACVDGPEFDARFVNFDELLARLNTYVEQEQKATCALEGQLGKNAKNKSES
jgi:ferredoxin--NADP+ reductase